VWDERRIDIAPIALEYSPVHADSSSLSIVPGAHGLTGIEVKLCWYVADPPPRKEGYFLSIVPSDRCGRHDDENTILVAAQQGNKSGLFLTSQKNVVEV